jgi:alpha-tubulin suppressor-like RCC1 family protein
MLIKTDGSLWAWGNNLTGQLGDGTTETRTSPVKVMDGVASVSAGSMYTMAVKTDGSLWAWGNNVNGMLGDGTKEQRHSPKKIMDGVKSVSAGAQTMILKTDGSLWACGGNTGGALGIGQGDYQALGTEKTTPVQVMDGVAYVHTNGGNTAAIKTDGSLWTWGDNTFGQLGDGKGGPEVFSNRPIKVMDGVSSVAYGKAGTKHFMILKTDGSLWACGVNDFGRYGNGTTTYDIKRAPVKIIDGVVAVSAGQRHTIALFHDGTLWSWGDNSRLQIGNGQGGSGQTQLTPAFVLRGVKLPSGGTTPVTPPPPSAMTVNPTQSTVYVNGKAVAFEAYLINSENYFKLRDIAAALDGTNKQFDVGYDSATRTGTIIPGRSYTRIGGELAPGDGRAKQATNSNTILAMNGSPLTVTAYMIESANFLRLRDLMILLDIYVGYDPATRAITIDTSRPYEG